MKPLTLGALVVLAVSSLSTASAQTEKFTVGNAAGMKASQEFTFDSVADFENFTGQTHKVTGSITINPKAGTASGRILVDIASIDTGMAARDEHLRSEQWFNTARFPNAVFETTSVKRKSGDTFEVAGRLMLHGVTRTIKTEATARYMKASEATRKAMFKGDVLNVKTSFKFRLADYGVTIPSIAKGKVGETITVRLNLFGYSG